MSDLPLKFILPDDRIPKPWSQGVYDCCVAASITKVLEVINNVKTGKYTMLSKGYVYGKHSRPDKREGGMDYAYAMENLKKYGTVPEDQFPNMNEIPDIIKDVNEHPDIAELDKEAEKTRIKDYLKIKGDIYFYDNVKKYLYEKRLPLVGNMVGKRHSAVIVGWDGGKLLYHDHNGKETLYKGKFNEAYCLVGGDNEMKCLNLAELGKYIETITLTRKIKRIQLHHTYSPSYKDFTGNNHLALQRGMRNYHVNTNGWADIGQHFTIFPDGTVVTGRDLDTNPAGIYGANTGAICVECLGNFDIGGDVMTEKQKETIVAVTKILLDKFELDAADDVTYHAWWGADGREIGDYLKSASVKTCPGTNFFGGNSLTAYRKNLQPLIENYGKAVTEISDIVRELENAGVITNTTLWTKKCSEDVNVYWLCRKMANKLRKAQ